MCPIRTFNITNGKEPWLNNELHEKLRDKRHARNIHTCIRTYIHTYTHAHTYIHTYIHTYTHIHAHTIHRCTHTYSQTCVRPSTHARMHARAWLLWYHHIIIIIIIITAYMWSGLFNVNNKKDILHVAPNLAYILIQGRIKSTSSFKWNQGCINLIHWLPVHEYKYQTHTHFLKSLDLHPPLALPPLPCLI